MVTPLANTRNTLVGAILSRRWKLVRKLGEGGMGEVYAAESVDGRTQGALKILRPEFLGDAEVRSRFLDEAHVCMRLLHPNIVRILECARPEDDSPYFVMELLDGVPLSAYMQNGARISVSQAAPIVQSILAGLAAAHANGVVHRDLKPDNVILTRDQGGAFVVKLVDFGIAKVMDAAGGMGNRTRTGLLLGTPAYMSPEQARSSRSVDQRTDLWSAGVLFYEMITGRVAFAAPTEYARLAALLSTEPESVDRVDPALSPLLPFFDRALRKNRDERFPNAGEMAWALAAIVPASAQRMEAPIGVGRNLGIPEGGFGAAHALKSRVEPTREMAAAGSGVTQRQNVGSGLPSGFGGAYATRPSEVRVAPRNGGTLASQEGGVANDPVPEVVFVDPRPLGGTLPSEIRNDSRASRGLAGRGVRRGIVALLVTLAFALGTGVGWLVARMT